MLAGVFADPSLDGWDGFGLAVQAYLKRAAAVIEWTAHLAERLDRRVMVRLVKGAYWDTEIKRAQERGLDDYPVFTRKAMTDLNYLACAEKLLRLRPRVFPQFATHNALTVASIVERAGGVVGYEFQRLHGMGEALYDRLIEERPGAACRTYAPVGGHRDLLAYLVRRLLENGANSSFVSVAADPDVPVESLLRRPADIIGAPEGAPHPHIPRPRDLFAPERRNSSGVEFGNREALETLVAEIKVFGATPARAAPLIDGRPQEGVKRLVTSPIDASTLVGSVEEAEPDTADQAMAAARAGFAAWNETPADRRASALRYAADLLEARRGRLIHLLQAEGGKTLDDAVAEVREAVDFCRYYAAEGCKLFGDGLRLPGPTGELNVLRLRGRGVFVAISPWNFPLAIFVGQVAAALVAGNCVVAKPAEQTPLIAAEAVRVLHEAGVPPFALQFVPGDGRIGARLVGHRDVAGRGLHRLDRGGALHQPDARRQERPDRPAHRRDRRHQRDDRRCHGPARAGGRRCRHVRLPLRRAALLRPAAALHPGGRRRPHHRHDRRRRSRAEDRRPPRGLDPHRPGDRRRCESEARRPCGTHETGGLARALRGRDRGRGADGGRRPGCRPSPSQGRRLQPVLVSRAGAVRSISRLQAPELRLTPSRRKLSRRRPAPEPLAAARATTSPRISSSSSGPRPWPRRCSGLILHVVRYRAADLDHVLHAIDGSGYGLTLGIHSRIDATADRIAARLGVGNVYVNRNMIGAVVGVQPFGGHGLSGTGPKAGGPHYLLRFATEQTITINTAAAGGNATLMGLSE